MAEVVLIAAAKGILTGLISQATDQINSPIKLAWGFKEDLEKLCERLEIIQALLHDAENRRITSEPMMVWLKKIKAATCDAENVLDELAYEDLRRKIEVQNRMRNKMRDLFTLSDPLSFRFKMANKVSKVNKLLDRICNAAKDIGLKPAKQLIGPVDKPMEFRKTGPAMGDTEVVGRDGDVNEVVDMLIGSDIGCDLPVIAMVGMGGLGKTTVARVVYKHVKVVDYFNERMWVCVSDDFKIERLLNEMVESLTKNDSNIKNREGIEGKLKEKLKGKKYLLVLDDVWNTESHLWVGLRNSLLEIGGSNESKILVTTRSKKVVSVMRTPSSCTHELMQLSMDDCWSMFRKRALAQREPSEAQILEGIGRRMVEKCKGLPLAINALGGLLYLKQGKQEWESIEKSEIWSSLEGEDGILPVLRLSFDHLPSTSLKQSFAYCSIFQKDQVIEKDELIQLWMGLGYLDQPSSKRKVEMEELGNEYFNTLLLNSLFQVVEHDVYNNITTCKMHDLVHDLALEVSQGNCYNSEASEMKINPDAQHLFYHRERTQLDIPEENVEKLRTLFLCDHHPKNSKYFKRIRALHVRSWETVKLSSSICKSIHFRFLNLNGYSFRKVPGEVPESITKLYNLETLKLPYICTKFPKGFHNLVKLRHLHLGEFTAVMPMKIGQLTSLRTLTCFVVGEESGYKIEELGSLSRLRGRLKIEHLQHVKDKEEAKKAKLLEKPDIQELQLRWDIVRSENNNEDVLEGLKPHQNLKGLKLTNFGGRGFPSWMSGDAHFLQNLVKIELRGCQLCEEAPALGHLSHLAIVEMSALNNLKRIGLEFYGLDEGITNNSSRSGAAVVEVFPALRKLYIWGMSQLEEWLDISSLLAVATSTVKSFAHLEELHIWYCPKLTTIPAFNSSTSLQKLEIIVCPELTYLPEGLLQPTLVQLYLRYCPKLKTPNQDALRSLTSLKELRLIGCPKLGSYWEEGLFCTTRLQSLDIGGLGEELRYFPWPSTSAASPPLCNFLSLESLSLRGWGEVKSLPDQLEHLTTLRRLTIHSFEGLESLPLGLRKLSSLRSLRINKCSLLKKRCEKGSGEDWRKIAHIPSIQIDWREIQ